MIVLAAREGMPVTELETPVLLLDTALLEANIDKMAKYARKQGVSLRPHAKTHKCPGIAHKQVQAGAIGITCAKVGEAEIMGYAGIQDILIANQVVSPGKIEKLVSLSNHCDLKVAVDNIQNAVDISRAAGRRGQVLKVIIERDIGMKRCGTRTVEETLRLAEAITGLPGLRLVGIMGYEGHTVFMTPREKRLEHCSSAIEILLETVEAMEKKGFSTEIVSSAGTGTFDITGQYSAITELQVGSYATMDWRYKEVGLDFQLALTVLATVISRPDRHTAIIDVGMKGVTCEFGLPVVKGMAGAVVVSLSEEHGKLELSGDALNLAVGDRIELFPTHGCTTINLYNLLHVSRDGLLEAVWPVAARGAVY
jgi:D-serine deaminase-like pyridoxal phosphate-dependent protein